MEIEFAQVDNGVSKVTLRGRMDVLGVQAIDMKFTAVTATRAALVLVDLSEVSFLASLGMRTLISSAKALAQRGGHMVLANPQPNVLEVMKVSGLSSVIPVCQHVDDAVQALTNFQSK
jgi:anti-sigma B factor antagonist